jgi:hypothetical protein
MATPLIIFTKKFLRFSMNKSKVAIVRYEKPLESVRKAVELSQGLDRLQPGAKVFIKPNIVFWTRVVPFPKWGVITTSRTLNWWVKVLKILALAMSTILSSPRTRTAQCPFPWPRRALKASPIKNTISPCALTAQV